MAASTLKAKTAQGHGTGLTAKAYTRDTDTLAANGTSSASTEGTNQKGTYTFTFTDLATGVYDLRLVTAADLTISSGLLNHTDAVGVEKPYVDLTGATVAAVTNAGTLTTSERDAIAAALLDLANGIETGLTLRGAARLAAASLAGKLSGAASATVTIRNAVQDSKARITATVDADGNRTLVTTDVT